MSFMAKRRHVSKRRLRSRFQRLLWSMVFLIVYLLLSIQIADITDDPSSNSNIFILLIGAIGVSAVGALFAPIVPVLLRVNPSRRQRDARGR